MDSDPGIVIGVGTGIRCKYYFSVYLVWQFAKLINRAKNESNVSIA